VSFESPRFCLLCYSKTLLFFFVLAVRLLDLVFMSALSGLVYRIAALPQREIHVACSYSISVKKFIVSESVFMPYSQIELWERKRNGKRKARVSLSRGSSAI
jgi:hypothetical protein